MKYFSVRVLLTKPLQFLLFVLTKLIREFVSLAYWLIYCRPLRSLDQIHRTKFDITEELLDKREPLSKNLS